MKSSGALQASQAATGDTENHAQYQWHDVQPHERAHGHDDEMEHSHFKFEGVTEAAAQYTEKAPAQVRKMQRRSKNDESIALQASQDATGDTENHAQYQWHDVQPHERAHGH